MQELENYWAVQTVQNRDTWLGTTASKVFTVYAGLDVPQTMSIVIVDYYGLGYGLVRPK